MLAVARLLVDPGRLAATPDPRRASLWLRCRVRRIRERWRAEREHDESSCGPGKHRRIVSESGPLEKGYMETDRPPE